MPNWLREEIIKKKAVISSSAQEHSKEDTQSIEDEGVEKSFAKGDQADSKSADSSRSTEEEDDDEVFSFFLMLIFLFSCPDMKFSFPIDQLFYLFFTV